MRQPKCTSVMLRRTLAALLCLCAAVMVWYVLRVPTGHLVVVPDVHPTSRTAESVPTSALSPMSRDVVTPTSRPVAAHLRVRVVDADLRPLENADVGLVRRGRRTVSQDDVLARSRTDTSGYSVLRQNAMGVLSNDEWAIVAGLPGYAWSCASVPEAHELCTIVLRLGTTLEVIAKDETDSGVSGVDVVISRLGVPMDQVTSQWSGFAAASARGRIMHARTNDIGFARIDGLEVGSYWLTIRCATHLLTSCSVDLSQPIQTPSGLIRMVLVEPLVGGLRVIGQDVLSYTNAHHKRVLSHPGNSMHFAQAMRDAVANVTGSKITFIGIHARGVDTSVRRTPVSLCLSRSGWIEAQVDLVKLSEFTHPTELDARELHVSQEERGVVSITWRSEEAKDTLSSHVFLQSVDDKKHGQLVIFGIGGRKDLALPVGSYRLWSWDPVLKEALPQRVLRVNAATNETCLLDVPESVRPCRVTIDTDDGVRMRTGYILLNRSPEQKAQFNLSNPSTKDVMWLPVGRHEATFFGSGFQRTSKEVAVDAGDTVCNILMKVPYE